MLVRASKMSRLTVFHMHCHMSEFMIRDLEQKTLSYHLDIEKDRHSHLPARPQARGPSDRGVVIKLGYPCLRENLSGASDSTYREAVKQFFRSVGDRSSKTVGLELTQPCGL